ncbi:MAG: DUF2868 domain-containing protein [Thermoanaerobaculia bacterium]|nr:DUF2868 domain-containing protein [Thermoanaerobaculia bacterium]
MTRSPAPDERIVTMGHGRAQSATLIRAVEEVDRRGDLLPLHERRQATREARSGSGEETGRWLGERASSLIPVLARDRPEVVRLLRLTDLGRGLFWPTVVLAALVGMATDTIGPERRIHVLAVPLLGLVLWNVVVLLLGLLLRVVPLLPGAGIFEKPRLVDLLQGWARRWIERRGEKDDPRDERWRTALRRYLVLWFPTHRPLAVVRVRRLLHAGAATIVLGAVAMMYLRGLVFEYRVTWESTFLGGAAVDRILSVVLAPAAAVLGRQVPSAAAAGPAGLPAAEWIHLWALTAALFVLIPRGVLVVGGSIRIVCRRRSTTLRVPEAYLRRLTATTEGRVDRVEIVPYSYHPSRPALESLEGLLHDLLGTRADVRARPMLEYGTDPSVLRPGASRTLLFSLGQTPEAEVHGELTTACRESLPDGEVLLAVVDASVYRRRLGETDPGTTRLAERRRAWDRVLGEAGITPTHLDLEEPDPDGALEALARGAWPTAEPGRPG